MKQHGRKSAGMLAIIPGGNLERLERPKAPDSLSPEEQAVWRKVVDSEPADWFTPSTEPLLEQYCRHVVRAELVAGMIAAWQGGKLFEYDRMLQMARGESTIILQLATKMRITQQSTLNHVGGKKGAHRRAVAAAAPDKPWNYGKEA